MKDKYGLLIPAGNPPTVFDYILFNLAMFMGIVIVVWTGRLIGRQLGAGRGYKLSRKRFWQHILIIVAMIIIAIGLLSYVTWGQTDSDTDHLLYGWHWLATLDKLVGTGRGGSKNYFGLGFATPFLLIGGILSVQWQRKRLAAQKTSKNGKK